MTAGRCLFCALCALSLGISTALSSKLLRNLPYAHMDEILPGLLRNAQRQEQKPLKTDYYADYYDLVEDSNLQSKGTIISSTTVASTVDSTVLTTTEATKTTTTVGTWSEWLYSAESKCSADCGACGRRKRVRTCLSQASGCPCIGLSEDRVPCNIGVCHFPKPSCCLPFQLFYVDGKFACGPQTDRVVEEFVNGIPGDRFVSRSTAVDDRNRIDFVQY